MEHININNRHRITDLAMQEHVTIPIRIAKAPYGVLIGIPDETPIEDDDVSQIIRGMEFKRQDAETCGECNVPGLAGHMAVVEFLREFMDFPTHEINVPLILMRQRQKMGKSMQSVPWMSLTMAAPELVKRFLIATAISPDDPFNVLYEPFELDKMSTTPYLWLWSDWAKVVKMS